MLQIRIDNIYGDALPQFSARVGIATAGENAGFSIASTIDVYDLSDNYFGTYSVETPVEKKPNATRDSDGFVELQFQYVPWGLGSYCGNAQVTFTSQLVNSNGQEIANPVTMTRTVWISHDPGCGY